MGLVKLKKIEKSEKISDKPDPTYPPPVHFFYLFQKHVQQQNPT